MKAVKNIFKRKKRRNESASPVPPKEEKAAMPKSIIRQNAPPPAQQPPQMNHTTSTASARTNGTPERNDTASTGSESRRNDPVASKLVPKREEAKNDSTVRSNGSAVPHEQAQAMETANNPPKQPEESDSNPEGAGGRGQPLAALKTSYKGVPDSFKSLTATQEFDVAQVESSDPNQMISLGDAYDAIPLIEQTKLPRGGISMETKAVGRVQFGIPPETIKDSMKMGIPVPQVYIVPAERFCREMGPALGVNLAEFEFPAYFNFFVYKKRCTLIVDSQEAQDNICRVFSETLLGPAQFRREKDPDAFEEEDFAPDFPKDARPNLQKELKHFRIMPDGSELTLETLLDFCQFKMPGDGYCHDDLGVPPNLDGNNGDEIDEEELDEALSMLGDEETGEEEVPRDAQGVEKRDQSKWSYKKARWVGDVATVWPSKATEDEIRDRSVPRVEIFKMPSGTEYIIHDIDENNQIIGRARFSGHVKVSESMGVEGFGSSADEAKADEDKQKDQADDDDSYNSSDMYKHDSPMLPKAPPTFHPPGFGLTTLGNSHGFDKSGSVSGYVLWINGRGIMIDPPPYSSATLEREGIRPRTIVGIILTHCHADHDAGAFQKVLTGSPVVVITTPTIYKSFIRKYAALASLSPALLRHSHRHKPAIIGEPLRFQGATFHFTYSLHTIPCVGFRVEWRGRSMVFTGDHMNKPSMIDQLQAEGVLSKARADDLRNLPLQETDLLLHEAGAPPIHTPIEELMKLPQRVKKRLYVVHTSLIPDNCDLRVAPTGTAGTLRLDQLQRGAGPKAGIPTSTWKERSMGKQRNTRDAYSISLEDDGILPSPWSSASNEYASINEDAAAADGGLDMMTSFSHIPAPSDSQKNPHRTSLTGVGGSSVPLVSLRPASSTDAWYILNLLSSVPFLSSLSYSSTMEVLETARVDAYCKNDVVVPVSRRNQLLCVVWEGTCVERNRTSSRQTKGEHNVSIIEERGASGENGAVWHAGDWTGPIALQPEKRLSGESELSTTHDIVAVSSEGVKIITIDFNSLHLILKSDSQLYRKYLDRRAQQQRRLSFEVGSQTSINSTATHKLLTEALKNLNVLELLDQNSALRKLSAVQKRHLESLAEGPIGFGPGERLWRSGASVNSAFLMVSGTASFVPRRRNAGSASVPAGHMGLTSSTRSMLSHFDDSAKDIVEVESANVGEDMQNDVTQAVEEMGGTVEQPSAEEVAGTAEDQIQLETLFSRTGDGQARSRSMTEAHDFAKLSKNLQKRAEILSSDPTSDVSVASSQDGDSFSQDSDHFVDDSASAGSRERRSSLLKRRSSRARFANKVLGRLYSRRAFTGGLVFSRGHFLGDVSKMVAGLLSTDYEQADENLENSPAYGFGDKIEGAKETIADNLTDMVIHEQEGDSHIVHTSTLTAGQDGCVVLVFPKSSLIPFLNEYPGFLLSLLGTQVVV